MKKKKVLLIYPSFSTFVKSDYKILSSKYIVDKYHFQPANKLMSMAFQLLKQLTTLLLRGWSYHTFYIWFGDYHSLLPILYAKLFKKKALLVIGGYDVCRIPRYKYGSFYKPMRGCFTILSIKNATVNLAVSNYIDRILRSIAPTAATSVVHNAISLKSEMEMSRSENLILMVAVVDSEQRYYIKGLDLFIDVARRLPKYRFVSVGVDMKEIENLEDEWPDNLEFIEKVDQNLLLDYYNQAKVYCQLSEIESFGLALAEGMYCGCLPVVTNVGALPDVVGDTRYVVKRDGEAIAKTIKKGIEEMEFPNANARNRVVELFTYERRKNQIVSHLL